MIHICYTEQSMISYTLQTIIRDFIYAADCTILEFALITYFYFETRKCHKTIAVQSLYQSESRINRNQNENSLPVSNLLSFFKWLELPKSGQS